MQLPPSSFKVRLIGFLGLLLSSLFAAWIWHSWNEASDYVEAQERGHVHTLVQTLAPLLGGELHEQAVVEYPTPDQVSSWEAAPTWLHFLRGTLVDGVRHSKLETPIYTLRLKDSAYASVRADREAVHVGAMEVVLTSSATPTWLRTSDYVPEMGTALFDGQAATTGVYDDERGAWISAFAPVACADGKVVGLLKADAAVSNLLIQARERMANQATFGLAVLLYAILGCVLLTLSVTRALTQVQLAAQRLGAGDYTTPFPISSSSREIRDLTVAFEAARSRIATHIEAQERLNAALEMTRVEAESANRAKSLFLANMSHDLRTPLNAIIGFNQVLRQGDLTEDQREIVDTVQRASESLHEIVGDILDFSRISEGRLELAETRFDVRALVQETGERMFKRAHDAGLGLTWSSEPDVPGMLYGDPARLRQILNHLLGNAIKFTEIGSIHLACAVDHIDEARALLRFEVIDTGVGIASDRRERLFEPFTQHEDSVGLARGTGIGLSLCRSLCHLLGGEIGADSISGQGSTFWFTVELACHSGLAAEIEAPDAVAPTPPTVAPLEPHRPGGPKRVLIAEDSAVTRRMALQMVRRLGYHGEVAVDGLEAVDAVRCETFDAILMDCRMPRMDGFEATEAIRDLGTVASQIPIIAFTEAASEEERERGRKAGMVDFLSKPVTLDTLGKALEHWCATGLTQDSPPPILNGTPPGAASGSRIRA